MSITDNLTDYDHLCGIGHQTTSSDYLRAEVLASFLSAVIMRLGRTEMLLNAETP